jgi:hypothetical protein
MRKLLVVLALVIVASAAMAMNTVVQTVNIHVQCDGRTYMTPVGTKLIFVPNGEPLPQYIVVKTIDECRQQVIPVYPVYPVVSPWIIISRPAPIVVVPSRPVVIYKRRW